MKRSKPYTRPALEFDIHVTKKLPDYGMHCIFRLHGGRGKIFHSPECPAAEITWGKAQLERVWRGEAPLLGADGAAAREQLGLDSH